MKVDKQDIDDVSFPDAIVSSFNFDPGNKSLCLVMNGACFDGLELPNFSYARLELNSWSNAHFNEFDPLTDKWRAITPFDDELKDICELKVENSSLFLRGFCRKSGLWTEIKICEGVTELLLLR